MTEYADRPIPNALPGVLRHAGYQTAYLQAAPLAFMHKDRFMPRAGFERVEGEESFGQCECRNGWGPDDRTLLVRATDLALEMKQAGKPWFLTVLAAGTHHPYCVPRDFQSALPSDSYERAAAFAFGRRLAC